MFCYACCCWPPPLKRLPPSYSLDAAFWNWCYPLFYGCCYAWAFMTVLSNYYSWSSWACPNCYCCYIYYCWSHWPAPAAPGPPPPTSAAPSCCSIPAVYCCYCWAFAQMEPLFYCSDILGWPTIWEDCLWKADVRRLLPVLVPVTWWENYLFNYRLLVPWLC